MTANPYIMFSSSRAAVARIADAAFAEAVRLHDGRKELCDAVIETRRLHKFGQFHLVRPEDMRTAADVEAAEAAAETASKAETRAVLRSRRLEALLRRAQNRELASAVLAEHGPAALAEAAEEDACVWEALPLVMRACGARASEREESAGLGLTDTVFEYVLPQGVLRAVVHNDIDPWRECEFVPASESKEDTMEFVNLTPHPISFYYESSADPRTHVLYDGPAEPWLVLPPCPGPDGRPAPARVSVEWTCTGEEGGVPVFAPKYGAVTGLPEPDGRNLFIVSKMVADAAAAEGRDCSDLRLVAQTVRDAYGRIVGCLGISRP